MTRRVGWYVHHQGLGHAHRARAVIGELAGRGVEVSVLSSLPDQGWAPWVELARDDVAGFRDPDAGGVLHYAPTDNQGHRDRMARIARWVAESDAAAVVVDVSVEVTVLARTLGVPTVVLAMPGSRTDRPHDLGYDIATALVAAWPQALAVPAHLAGRLDRTTFVGGVSRFDGRPAPPPAPWSGSRSAGRQVLLVGGAGGSALTSADLDAARSATPGWTWTVAGPPGQWCDDVWPLLHRADVVVAGAGQGSVADLAAAGARAVVLAQDRPYDEQRATASVLARAGLAVVRDHWPRPQEWPGLLDEAAALAPRWERWEVAGAAARFADVVEAVARR